MGFWWQNLREKDHLEDRIIDEKEVLKLILKKSVGRVWTHAVFQSVCKLVMDATSVDQQNETVGTFGPNKFILSCISKGRQVK